MVRYSLLVACGSPDSHPSHIWPYHTVALRKRGKTLPSFARVQTTQRLAVLKKSFSLSRGNRRLTSVRGASYKFVVCELSGYVCAFGLNCLQSYRIDSFRWDFVIR